MAAALARLHSSCDRRVFVLWHMISLTQFGPEHFPILASWFSSEAEVVSWGGPFVSFPLDDRQLAAMLDEGGRDPPRRLCWMAAAGGALVGHAQVAFDWRNGNAVLGRVALAPAARGQRLAGPMLELVIDRAFAWPELERIELNVFSFNAPAIRTYERLGFVHEGTRRASARVGAERWDTCVMGLLRAEWQR